MLIFFDIDGTLISETTHIMLESTKRAIRKARENGHICIVNTGRSKKLVGADVTGLTEFDGYLIGCGTLIIYRDEVLLHETFEPDFAREIIDSLRRNHIDAVLEGTYNNFRDRDERIFTDVWMQFIHSFDNLEYGSYEEAPGNIDKFYCYAEKREYMDEFEKEFKDRLEFVDRKKGFYEVTPKGFTKASAMQLLADRLGISMEETVAIGDSSNDISMITCANIGIAMGNASEDVKALADYVAKDVDEDGIEDALKWLGAI